MVTVAIIFLIAWPVLYFIDWLMNDGDVGDDVRDRFSILSWLGTIFFIIFGGLFVAAVGIILFP